jgi:hypothetical protein
VYPAYQQRIYGRISVSAPRIPDVARALADAVPQCTARAPHPPAATPTHPSDPGARRILQCSIEYTCRGMMMRERSGKHRRRTDARQAHAPTRIRDQCATSRHDSRAPSAHTHDSPRCICTLLRASLDVSSRIAHDRFLTAAGRYAGAGCVCNFTSLL